MKQASKALASKFAASAAVLEGDELQIQGDIVDELMSFIPTKWPVVPAKSITVKAPPPPADDE